MRIALALVLSRYMEYNGDRAGGDSGFLIVAMVVLQAVNHGWRTRTRPLMAQKTSNYSSGCAYGGAIMALPPGLRHVVAQTRLFTDAQNYIIVRLPGNQISEAAVLLKQVHSPLISLTWDKDEVSLVLPAEVWESLRPGFKILNESPEYRLITFDLPLDLGLVGYLALMVAAVAEAGVSVYPVSAFSRDHLLVPTEDFEPAWEALRHLIRSCQAEEATERG